MNNPIAMLVSASLLACSIACGPASSGGLTCDLPIPAMDGFGATHICAFYPEGTKSGSCPSGASEVSSCSTSDKLGTCSIQSNGVTMTQTLYSDGGLTLSEAQQVCSNDSGTWSQ
jgi:hypothetical protein